MRCEDCGKDFETTRRVKRFCSEGCRKRAERRRWKRRWLEKKRALKKPTVEGADGGVP